MEKYDVVVVGAGNAALSAAISAREIGSKVLVLEKGPKSKRGGNSFFTDGAIRFAYGDINGIQTVIPELTERKIKTISMPIYENQDFYNDIMRVTKNQSNPDLVNHLVNNSFETILWMKEQGVEFELNENQCFERNGVLKFWGGLPIRTKRKGIGLIEALLKKAEEQSIDFKYEARAVELEKSSDGISGIYYKDVNKKRYFIETSSVVLACGSFEASKEDRIKFLGKEWANAIVRGTEFNTGDGIRMAVAVGAQKAGHYSGCHAHTTDYNAPKVGDFSKPGDIYKKSSYPLGLIINNKGERFVDEGADFRNYTYAKYGKETLKQPEQKAFQIYDSQVISMLRKEYELDEATKISAKTLEELADKMGINPSRFKEMIDEYNASVQDGDYNPSIKDGKSTKNITPPKSNWALKFEKAPFYAFPVTCGITFSFGGVATNTNGEVLDSNGEAISGLYAVGEMVGGLFYHNYPGGSGLMSGSVFGRTAGTSAAKYTQNKSVNFMKY
ncbi:FAD-dependent tricarballylate dehydrogenase TcuA [Pseudalkalibacillus sp. A8]|uniref:FAD-dependent tricarballylate dehydrogenase TcuA n=1 Tax=Pseudalkalibacillus sp. A8 TaxID=3382641 RepID=UPI0038B699C8